MLPVCATSPSLLLALLATSPYCAVLARVHTLHATFPADGLPSGASQEEASQREGDCRAARASGGDQARDPTGNQGVPYALLEHCLASQPHPLLLQASTEWTRVNEAKRLLVLGETSVVQETSCSEQQLQQDGSETQDVHTTGSPVPTGLTTPSVQSPPQPVTALQPTPSLAPVPHTMVKATWTLFQTPHTDSVLDVKVCLSCLSVSLSVHLTHSHSLHRWSRMF